MDTQFSTTNQPKDKAKTLLTLEQRIAQLEDKLSREKKELRKRDDGQKYVVGGMVIGAARKQDSLRKWLIEHLEKDVTRKADMKRVAPLIAELKQLQAQTASAQSAGK